MHAGSGEWIWRPGFGLIQRDRAYEHYKDIEVHYERRPSYWVEPSGAWGEGAIELTEIPTLNEYAARKRASSNAELHLRLPYYG
jgi:periplasmic glucans biosynthesis protein